MESENVKLTDTEQNGRYPAWGVKDTNIDNFRQTGRDAQEFCCAAWLIIHCILAND